MMLLLFPKIVPQTLNYKFYERISKFLEEAKANKAQVRILSPIKAIFHTAIKKDVKLAFLCSE